MAVVAISDSILTDIAEAIRSKNGTENTYKPAQMPDAIEAISGGGITPTGTKEITANGTGIDVASYAYADVAVPNSYSAGDEGKVVSNGALVSQTSDTVTSNDTYDTTLINSLTVNVSGGVTPTGTKQISITQNGTTTENVTNYANAEITVNVSSGGWIRIIDDTPSNYYKNGGVSLSNNVFTIHGVTNWNNCIFSRNIFFRYSELVGKRIRMSCDYVATGFASGDYLTFIPSLFNTTSPGNSNSRTNYPSQSSSIQSVCKITENGSDTFAYDFVLSSEIISQSTIVESQWVGFSIYINANSNASVTISNISMEVNV